MSNSQLLQNYSEAEKTAYLSVVASLASADRQASANELQFLQQLAHAAGLTDTSTQQVVGAARDSTNQSVQHNLDFLRGSDLRFSLITDLISFARADGAYSNEEEAMVNKIAAYLQINAGQQQVLEQVVDQAASVPHDTSDPTKQGFLGGLTDKLASVGVPKGALMAGLLGVVAPMVLSKVMNRDGSNPAATGGTVGGLLNSTGNNSIGDVLGGFMGGSLLGNVLGGSMSNVTNPYDTSSLPQGAGRNGGLGSIISILGGLGQQSGALQQPTGGGLGSLLGGNMGNILSKIL